MRLRPLAALFAAGLFIAPALADKRKTANAPETLPEPRTVAQLPRPCDAACPGAPTLPTPRRPDHPPQYLQAESGRSPAGVAECRECAAAAQKPADRQMLKVYSVADLVIPPPPVGPCPTTSQPKTREAELMKKITESVEPRSWSSAGGLGSMDYFPIGLALVVNQTPEVQAAVARFLDSQRRLQDHQIATQLCVMMVSDEWFEKVGLAREFADAKPGTPRARFLTSAACERMVRSAKSDSAISILTAPKITTLNGQPARVRVGQTEYFITGVTVQNVNGQIVCVPKNETQDLGIDLTVEPTVSADGTVHMTVAGSLRELGAVPVPMATVTTQVPPIPEKGKTGEPVPVAQLLQAPTIVTRTVSEAVVLPDGGTALLYGGKATIEGTVKEKLPGLAEVPVLADLLAKEKKVKTTNHMLVLVTSHIVRPDGGMEECEACCKDEGCCKADGKLARLLTDYHRACRDAKTDEARRLAIECLAIDPTCFGKQ